MKKARMLLTAAVAIVGVAATVSPAAAAPVSPAAASAAAASASALLVTAEELPTGGPASIDFWEDFTGPTNGQPSGSISLGLLGTAHGPVATQSWWAHFQAWDSGKLVGLAQQLVLTYPDEAAATQAYDAAVATETSAPARLPIPPVNNFFGVVAHSTSTVAGVTAFTWTLGAGDTGEYDQVGFRHVILHHGTAVTILEFPPDSQLSGFAEPFVVAAQRRLG